LGSNGSPRWVAAAETNGGNHGSNLPGFGHNISHSHRRTKRRFDPNVQKKTYYVPSLRRNVTLQLSAKGIKTIDARGIESVVKDILARGVKI
jgi:large subunit ribosomal protein L28